MSPNQPHHRTGRSRGSANELNQYTSIIDGADSFEPQFDLAGNQTLVKTGTGIWRITYNAENRPVRFESEDGNIVVECAYDNIGRRSTKKVTTNGNITLHQRYIYRGYLQIACCDLTRAATPALWYIFWDPTQPIATRPLAIQKDGVWYAYGWDLTKNICEIYGQTGYIRTLYTYTPYGAVTEDGDVTQPIQWSSEFYDSELGLVYYNQRNYNNLSGRWLIKDKISKDNPEIKNLYRYCKNGVINNTDRLGYLTIIVHGTFAQDAKWWRNGGKFAQHLNDEVGDVWKISKCKECIIKEFFWNGELGDNDRKEAGRNLAIYILKVKAQCPDEPINIVAHSHGGNVVLAALSAIIVTPKSRYCNRTNTDFRVDNVVLLATPHFYVHDGMKKTPQYLSSEAISMVKGKIYNIYSEEDQVQTKGAESFHGIPLNNYNRKDLYVAAERTIPQAYGEDIEIKTKVGGYDAHGVLHSTTMGTMIGQLLKGSEPNWPVIIDDDDKGE